MHFGLVTRMCAGTIPVGLSVDTFFERFDVHNNRLTGQVPEELASSVPCEAFIDNCFQGQCSSPQSPYC